MTQADNSTVTTESIVTPRQEGCGTSPGVAIATENDHDSLLGLLHKIYVSNLVIVIKLNIIICS